MIIDIHAEIITHSYLSQLLKYRGVPRIVRKGGGYLIFYGNGLSYPFDERMYDLSVREKEMEKSGIDIQVLGLAMPGVDMLRKDLAVRIARESNDELSEISRKNPRFLAFATVPMKYPALAIREMERSVNELGLRGIKIPSNVDGKPLDWKGFYPIYETAERLEIPILIHPTTPLMSEVMRDYGLTTVVGFLFDTTLAVLRLIFSGTLEKFKGLRLILPHAGSIIPYLISRIDHQYAINPDCKKRISRPPSEYFQRIYVDTAQSFYLPAFNCAYQLMTAERMVLGSDYPFVSLEKSVEFIKNLNVSDGEKEKILSENAKRLLKLI
ncbi:MAG: amidohydrolase family protein [Candidatus Hadarchaeum sp.]|uniref:amidohydrolase family protein n=1 Tax=Candidatus Hadarchaeum sp. TaxID=2883567 RepID=UPI003D108130